MKIPYRAEIDGLRAVAVLSVVLFHAYAAALPGGFVGVDIFFVISGYLITGMLLAQDVIDRAFLQNFYERRVRRLLPPVIPVLLLSIVGGYVILLPDETVAFARSLAAFLLFRSNWYFLNIAGYFDGPSHLKPLLHTWSLSVEEQFYLLFPTALALMGMHRARRLNVFLLGVLLASFTTAMLFSRAASFDAAFFNSCARFWEIALGALIASGAVKPAKSTVARTATGLLGVTVIVFCDVGHAPAMAFPALWAAGAALGAALVILAPATVVSRALAARPLVGIGLVSYGFYLWHWPLLAFLRITVRAPGVTATTEAVVTALLLAVVSYHLIERPIRSRTIAPRPRQMLVLFVTSSLAFGAIGVGGIVSQGYPARFPKQASDYQQHLVQQRKEQRHAALKNICWLSGDAALAPALAKCLTSTPGRARVLLVGDSHAAHLFDALKRAYTNIDLQLLAVNSCSLSGNDFDRRRAPCKGIDTFLDELPPGRFDTVIMTSHAVLSAEEMPGYIRRAARLATATRVIVLGPTQEYQPTMPSIYARFVGRFSQTWIARRLDASVSSERFAYDQELHRAFAGIPNVTYVSLLEVLCPNRKCRHFDADGWPLLIDNSHFSVPAAMQLVKDLDGRLPLREAGG